MTKTTNDQSQRDPLRPLVAAARRAVRWRLPILFGAALLTIGSVIITRDLSFTSDLTALLPDHNPDLQRLRALQSDQGAERQFMVMFSQNYLFATDKTGKAHRYDGERWYSDQIASSLEATWGFGSADVFVAGSDGTVAHFAGQSWSVETSGGGGSLRGLWGAKAAELFAVGDGGRILRRSADGRWAAEPSGTDEDLYAVSGHSEAGVVVAVGANGVVLLRRDGRWEREDAGVATRLNGAWVGPRGAVFVVGDGGLLLTRDEAGWRPIAAPVTSRLAAVWGSAADNVYAVGDGGVLLHFDGAKLLQRATQTTEALESIHGVLADAPWAAGAGCFLSSIKAKHRWFYGVDEIDQRGSASGCKSEERCAISFSAVWRPRPNLDSVIERLPELADALRRSPLVGRVVYRKPVGFFEDRALYYLSVTELDELVQSVEERLDRETAKGTGLFVDLEEEDGEDGDDDRLAQLKGRMGDTALQYGNSEWYLHPDGASIGVVVYTKPGQTGLEQLRALKQQIERVVERSGYRSWDPQLRAVVGGDAVQKLAEFETTLRDIQQLAWLAIGGIVLMLLLYFRRVVGLLFVVVPLGMSIAWTFAITTLVIGQLNVITGFLFAVLFGLGIDYGLQLYGRYREARLAGESVEAALDVMLLQTGRATLISAVTSGAALLTLTIAEFKGFSEFGFIAGVGVLLAVAAFLLVLPVLVSLADKYGLLRLDAARRESSVRPSSHRLPFPIRWRRTTLLLSLAGVVLGLVALPRVQFEYDHSVLRPDRGDDPTRHRTKSSFGASFTPTQFQAPSRLELVAAMESVQRTSQRLGDKSKVRRTTSILDLVPGRQREKRLLLDRFAKLLASRRWRLLSEERRQEIELAKLRRMAAAAPFDVADLPASVRRLFHGPGFGDRWLGLVFYQANMSDTRDARRFRDQVGQFKGSRLARLGSVLPPGASARVDGKRVEIVCQPQAGPACIGRARQSLEGLRHDSERVFPQILTREQAEQSGQLVPGGQSGQLFALAAPGFIPTADRGQPALAETGPFHVSSAEVVMTEVVEVMLSDARVAFVLAFAAVWLLCLLDFRSARWALLACLPLTVGLLWVVAALYLTDLKLDMFNFVVLPVLVGIGIDYGIHFVHRYREEGTHGLVEVTRVLYWVLLFCAATTTVGFGNMVFAHHPGLRSLGRLSIIGLAAMFVASCYTLPAILSWVSRGKTDDGERA